MKMRLLASKVLAVASLLSTAVCADVLASSGFTNCLENATVKVEYANITFDKDTGIVFFDAAGSSSQEQKVRASLVVIAYGQQTFEKSFDPCDNSTYVSQLCPIPKGDFAASGSQQIPSDYLSKIPSIAFSVPDIDASAQLNLVSLETEKDVACVRSGVTNGKSIELPAISAVSGVMLGASLLLTGFGAVANAGCIGSTSPAPTFSTVFLWFQSMAQNGMLSINYPPIYRSFTKNFGFSAGLLPWSSLQSNIDSFRAVTGGNLTEDNVQYLRNATLAFTDGEHNVTTLARRRLPPLFKSTVLHARDISTSVNPATSSNASSSSSQHLVSGIQGYVEMLSIPQSNTFLTVLLVFSIVVAAIIVGILGFKLILETWALFATFPNRLVNFRKRYWRTIAQTLTMLILLLYGIWTIWCIFQWTNGDSWAAKTLAVVTWALFTATLLFYTTKIFMIVHKYKKQHGNSSALYEDAETWHKYSFMYDSYKQGYWWLFVPAIGYMFAKGVVIAAGNGHGMTQTVIQLIIESAMFILLLWSRPFATSGSNWINNSIQFVRLLSVACILVFVEELGISQTTKTITGVILIAVQVGLTAVLGILLAVNAVRVCFRTNPHSKRLKEARKRQEQLERGDKLNEASDPKLENAFASNSSAMLYGRSSQMGMQHKTTSMTSLTREAAPISQYPGHEGASLYGTLQGDAYVGEYDNRLSRQPTLPVLGSNVPSLPFRRDDRRPAIPTLHY